VTGMGIVFWALGVVIRRVRGTGSREAAEYNGKPTPMYSILWLRAFGFKVRSTTNVEGVVDWDEDILLYGNVQFGMPQLRSMTYSMMASAQQQMLSDFMLLQVNGEGGIAPNTTACPVIH
jgi:hypothetical protein